MQPIPGLDPWRQLQDHLHGKDTLIVLDNFEHLLPARTDLQALLAVSGVRLLVTSRTVLNIPQEAVYALEGLSVTRGSGQAAEAVALLQERVRQTHPMYTWTPKDLQLATEVCQQLEGHPLATEMVAGWIRYMSLPEVLELLKNGGFPLESPLHPPDSRHHSIGKVLETSTHLLPEKVLAVLIRLSVFDGPFSFQAAQQVTGLVWSDVRTLLDYSLLRSDHGGGFSLHPLIREHLKVQLQVAPFARDTRETYTRHHLGLLKNLQVDLLTASRAREALDRLELQWPNLQGAWHTALTLGLHTLLPDAAWALTHYGELRGRYREAIDLFETVKAQVERGQLPLNLPQAEVLCALTYLYMRRGEVQLGLATAQLVEDPLEEHRASTHPWARWVHLQGVAAGSYLKGDPQRTLQACQESLKLAERWVKQARTPPEKQLGTFMHAISHNTLCILHLGTGDMEKVQVHLGMALQILENHDSPYLTNLYWLKGQLHHQEGDLNGAVKWLEKALEVAEKVQYETLTWHSKRDLGRVLLDLGRPRQAERLLAEALEEVELKGNRWAHLELLETLGRAYRQQGQREQALATFQRAFVKAAEGGILNFAAGSICHTAEMLLERGRVLQAHGLLGLLTTQPGVNEHWLDRARTLTGRTELTSTVPWQDLAASAFQEDDFRGQGLGN